jgi:hypothetical protein
MNEESPPRAEAVDPAMNEKMRTLGYGGPTRPARGGMDELTMRLWMAKQSSEIKPGTVLRDAQTSELMQWDGKEWNPILDLLWE